MSVATRFETITVKAVLMAPASSLSPPLRTTKIPMFYTDTVKRCICHSDRPTGQPIPRPIRLATAESLDVGDLNVTYTQEAEGLFLRGVMKL